MPITERPEIPAGARDITDDVVRMKSDLNDLLEGEDTAVIGTAIGAIIGENVPDRDVLIAFLQLITATAAEHFALNNPDVLLPEGARIN